MTLEATRRALVGNMHMDKYASEVTDLKTEVRLVFLCTQVIRTIALLFQVEISRLISSWLLKMSELEDSPPCIALVKRD